jgi:hypothetical protein
MRGERPFDLAQPQTGAACILVFRRVMQLVDGLVELLDSRTQPLSRPTTAAMRGCCINFAPYFFSARRGTLALIVRGPPLI